ncbi:outer membrane beta-barrel protein [Roseateles sp.]|uniref:outer membrane beta-barrel protein n=1 Tax=Roseateles sp. TaxID=1971397 RepID=UPI003265983B
MDCRIGLIALAAIAALTNPAQAQTDDTAPFYAGGSLGASHVSNVYRQSSAPNSDTVTSAGLLGGIDQRLGRQHLTVDGSLQNNRYSTNRDLNYRSHSIRGALNWQTVGKLSGVLSAKSDRSLADFNTSGVAQIFKKNIESTDEYQAQIRMGVATRYTLEGAWTQRSRNFSAEEYDRYVYRQNTGSLGIYLTPAGNVRLGLAGRRTKGTNPRYPTGLFTLDPDTLLPKAITDQNDYTRDDIDFTTRWRIGGHSTVNTRISRSKANNSMDRLRDFSGTTGSVGWNWSPTAKLQFNLNYARDTGQESSVNTGDLNRVYTTWQLGSSYALTSKLSLSARASANSARRNSDSGVALTGALDDTKSYNVGLRWAISRSFSLGCQYDHVNRDNSVPQYIYSANSYGCTGQAIVY